MRSVTTGLVVALALAVVAPAVSASGPVGIYGIIERVVFEPSESAPERVQVWGVFAYVNGCAGNPAWPAAAPRECGVAAATAASTRPGTSPVERGYLYFKLPDVVAGLTTPADVDAAKREWADMKAMAGGRQAIAFGRWGLVGRFEDLRPATRADGLPLLFRTVVRGGEFTDVRVRPASEAPADPATYQTNAGIVRLDEGGSHADVVAQLRAGLR